MAVLAGAALACAAAFAASAVAPAASVPAPATAAVSASERAAPSQAAPAVLPTRAAVRAAASAVRADPDLSVTRSIQTLRWKQRDTQPDTSPQWNWDGLRSVLRWLARAIRAVTQGARVLVWLLGAALVIWVLWRLRHWAGLRGEAWAGASAAAPPSHVGQLDIQPESLPQDIGAAVAALWRGEQYEQRRAALALLYRGALSRLVHGQAAVPIRATSTEGDCLALARTRLPGEVYDFFAGLVQVWQRAAYGARLPETAHVLALCDGFASYLPPASAPAGQKGAP
jgi:hypothetical protein